ncbi:LacI family DNA-binding transcriptional regulator [Ktedonobacter racemifer]|uniref:Transcriptional regulator, LacI family n=1 Tax=Ktedonobacter racemifer DSM 44963 TaxID=485913 RepID=D6U4Q3_KTERA|nr:LacI family DNA-binding transcriptional regulator [Ktedonobacter racemifer]EFH81483.1 transcriptional regulator, LacI family [Ktedonobacter racemifer DSM 44963]
MSNEQTELSLSEKQLASQEGTNLPLTSLEPLHTEGNKLRPTMQDVAEMAGVSLKTVSRVVNKEASVTQATRERVEAVIKSLGFRRNDLARNLRQGQTSSTIGLVIEDIANPFYSQLAQGVEYVARRYNHMLILSNSEENSQREREQVSALSHRRVAGLLIVPAGSDHSYLKSEMERGTPVIFVDRPPANLDVDMILLDSYGGSYTAVKHLLCQGHRRIGLICGDPSVYTGSGRVAAYRTALADWGIILEDDLLCFGCDDAEKAAAATQRLLSLPHPPTAVFTTSNRISVAVLRALRGVTRRLAFVGFDDFELADMLPTPVTVIAHDAAEMGRQAAELLFARIQGDERPTQRVIIPTRLIMRGSGEIPPEG